MWSHGGDLNPRHRPFCYLNKKTYQGRAITRLSHRGKNTNRIRLQRSSILILPENTESFSDIRFFYLKSFCETYGNYSEKLKQATKMADRHTNDDNYW